MKIRVATYNIHKGVSSVRGLPRVHALKQAIGLFDAEVVFLQEVQGKHDRKAARFGAEKHGHKHWPQAAQHEFFSGESRHLHAAYGMNAVYDHGHHGNALLSAYPIASMYNHDVSDHAYEQRGILHCVLRTPAADVHCYVVHLGLFEAGRSRQTEALIEAVMASAPDGEPVIIAGDFNDWRNTLSDKLRKQLGVVEVFDQHASKSALGDLVRTLARRKTNLSPIPARTFPAALPWFRLDRIYVRGFQVESAQVMHGTLWAKLSDHAPIVASLKLA
ncbi:endonuclease/exonuclease/phosphatase family protein [Janthinobacterium agaricidamnosum]|uniref:Endonuclease/Exonuclease/phosphatase family protein n=1 Tax=Janthinobacterium agaricidamnosum NBRC 102515 = DSM 9628 TaxID=1349767 RepID=W0V9G5_9BURK|nr:endonuclease/exonuclease/phosphatase family protein [Janthinobacterium agaricidamnosum]CDG85444.1 endonuclease/Exonuclease/phosphatase family protein [Janthinobacterium agaricidamnosum NBRC 102515 = DSM 9628]